MKKIAACMLLVFMVQGASYAQKGNNGVSVVAEAPITLTDVHLGWGAYLKGYYGIGKSGQITLMTGLSLFQRQATEGKSKTQTRLIPVLVGYKHHVSRFYIEPQAGLGEMGGRIDWGSDFSRPSVTAAYAALGAGVDIRRFEVGLRYQYAKGIESAAAGLWSDRKFETAALHIGYRIF